MGAGDRRTSTDDDAVAPTSASATSVRAMGAVSSSCPRERLSERVPVPAVLRPAALLLHSELARWFLAWDFWVGDFGCRQGLCVGFGGFWFVDVDLVAAGAVVGVSGASALFAGRQMFGFRLLYLSPWAGHASSPWPPAARYAGWAA